MKNLEKAKEYLNYLLEAEKTFKESENEYALEKVSRDIACAKKLVKSFEPKEIELHSMYIQKHANNLFIVIPFSVDKTTDTIHVKAFTKRSMNITFLNYGEDLYAFSLRDFIENWELLTEDDLKELKL